MKAGDKLVDKKRLWSAANLAHLTSSVHFAYRDILCQFVYFVLPFVIILLLCLTFQQIYLLLLILFSLNVAPSRGELKGDSKKANS